MSFQLLRSYLGEIPSDIAWELICDLFEFWDDDTPIEVALEYANEHLSRWPDELRVYHHSRHDISLPSYWNLVRNLACSNSSGESETDFLSCLCDEPESLRLLSILKVSSLPSCPVLQMAVEKMPSLSSLRFDYCVEEEPFSGFPTLPNVTHLSLDNYRDITQCRFLQYFPNLKKLDLVGCNSLCNLNDLELTPLLEHLCVWGYTCVNDISGLRHCKKLKRLELYRCERVLKSKESYECLSFCSQLEELHLNSIYPNEHEEDLFTAALAKLASLKTLVIKHSSLSDLHFLKSMEFLERLELSGYLLEEEPSSMPFLPNISELVLECEGCLPLLNKVQPQKITSLVIEGMGAKECAKKLRAFPNLRTLGLQEIHDLKTFEPLSFLTQLTSLSIETTSSLRSLRGLENCQSLQELSIYSCKELRTLDEIRSLEELQRIELAGLLLQELGDWGRLSKLIKIELADCDELRSFDGLQKLPYVRELELFNCHQFVGFRELGDWKHLKKFTWDCIGRNQLESFEGLPPTFGINTLRIHDSFQELWTLKNVGSFKQLRELSISDSKQLKLEDFEQLGECSKLCSLSMSLPEKQKTIAFLEQMPLLRELEIEGNEWIVDVAPFLLCRDLEELSMSNFPNITSIDCKQFPRQLRSLRLDQMDNLTRLEGADKLALLEVFALRNCPELDSSVSLENNLQLTNFVCFGCGSLEEIALPQLSYFIKSVSITYCGGIEKISVGTFSDALTYFEVDSCYRFRNLCFLQQATNIQQLKLGDCSLLPGKLSLPCEATLRVLELENYINFSDSQQLKDFDELTTLSLSHCRDLTELDGFETLTKLYHLVVDYCPKLDSIDGIRSMRRLSKLSLGHNDSLSGLSALEDLEQIHELDIRFCPSLSSLQGIERLEGLSSFCAEGCTGLRSLEGIADLDRVWGINVKGCSSLENFHPLDRIQDLHGFEFDGCDGIRSLRGFPRLEDGQRLEIDSLRGLESLDYLPEDIEYLIIKNCPSLRSLRGLERLHNLSHLEIESCENLGDVTSLCQMESLLQIRIADCKRTNFPTKIAGEHFCTANTVLLPAWRWKNIQQRWGLQELTKQRRKLLFLLCSANTHSQR